MIFETLQIINEDINTYLSNSSPGLANIAMIEGEGGLTIDGNPDTILTLINLQEEATLKNIPNKHITGTKVNYKNPKIYLNLYVLFTVNKATYVESLKTLTKVITFFQGKKIFTQNNTDILNMNELGAIKSFKFHVDLYTPTFEELNYIWGTLGGKQYPSVLYKISVLQLERDEVVKEGAIITQVENVNLIKN